MTLLLLFAFLSGIVTILSPCILPVLPVVLSGTVGGRRRPWGVIAGFVFSFSLFTLALSSLVRAFQIPPDALRWAAAVLIVLFGLVMALPPLQRVFEHLASGLTRRRPGGTGSREGFAGGLAVGFSLGLVWTPCVGPIMASVISLAAARSVDGGAVLIILAYSLGTSLPMLGIMAGGRKLLKKLPPGIFGGPGIQRIFGVLMILVGLTMGLGLDRRFQAAVLRVFPQYGAGLTSLENWAPVRKALETRRTGEGPAGSGGGTGPRWTSGDSPREGVAGDYGPAPELVTAGEWFNTPEPLSMEALRGKVVLVDFWTYSCVNCVRTLPHLRAWQEAYGDRGLVILGVHTPEFAFERDPENLRRAIQDLGVTWPVVQDNDYLQWQAYGNRYWPAHYFIDARGRMRYFQFGEGGYDGAEKVIRELLTEAGEAPAVPAARVAPAVLSSRTEETYLGYQRAGGFFSRPEMVNNRPAEYVPRGVPGNGRWTLEGTWTVSGQYAVPAEGSVLELGFQARDVYLVIQPEDTAEEAPGWLEVLLDGMPVSAADVEEGILRPRESRLYQLVGLEKPGEHRLRLTARGRFRLFAFTFG